MSLVDPLTPQNALPSGFSDSQPPPKLKLVFSDEFSSPALNIKNGQPGIRIAGKVITALNDGISQIMFVRQAEMMLWLSMFVKSETIYTPVAE